MRINVLAFTAALAAATASQAAVPEYGSRPGELACAGLVGYAFRGASASQPPNPQVVTATAAAYGFYMGRLSKLSPAATKTEVNQVLEKLSLEEKNTYGNLCLKSVSSKIDLPDK